MEDCNSDHLSKSVYNINIVCEEAYIPHNCQILAGEIYCEFVIGAYGSIPLTTLKIILTIFQTSLIVSQSSFLSI